MSELLEQILSNDNMNIACKKVVSNKGAGGVDGVEVEDIREYIKDNWDSIKEQIRQRQYRPLPVRRQEIPKPDGSKRKLGIPTVMDRVIQQGIAQVISPMCEPLFSEHSYGFRPVGVVSKQSGKCLYSSMRDMSGLWTLTWKSFSTMYRKTD